MEEAWNLVLALDVGDFAALSTTSDPQQQAAVCVALEYIGDKDPVWARARNRLHDGDGFRKELQRMERDKFVTRRSIRRMEAIAGGGSLALVALHRSSTTAFALAAYVDACLRAARERLGLLPPAPQPGEEPPVWPMAVSALHLSGRGAEAACWGRTALITCGDQAADAEDFFANKMCFSMVDVPALIDRVLVRRMATAETTRSDVEQQLAEAAAHGKPICVSLGRALLPPAPGGASAAQAVADLLPPALLNNKALRVLQQQDPSLGPSARDSYTLLTTAAASIDEAHQQLSRLCPDFAELAIVLLEPPVPPA